MKSKATAPSGIMLYAKSSGLTSFSSLWSIKHALGTDKVGHTGTLDSFADGLLVVLSGSLTHIVPHITGFRKTYLAVVCFGSETDTLDPTGDVVGIKDPVTRQQLESVLPGFTGALLQTPPLYSAVHVDGVRSSDAARSGKEVHLDPRQIFVYKNSLLDFKEATEEDRHSYALLEITCSKGTYIRSLARDIALALGSLGHLSALRRTEVGPFKLSDAACTDGMEEFTIERGIRMEKKFQEEKKKLQIPLIGSKKKKRIPDSEEKILDIRNHFMTFNSELALKCGFDVDVIKPNFIKSYLNGRPLSSKMFDRLHVNVDERFAQSNGSTKEIAVFFPDGNFAGMIRVSDSDRLFYGFVVPPPKKELAVFSWEDIVSNRFPVSMLKRGTAISCGSFEAIHCGHLEIIDFLKTRSEFACGVVTFSSRIKKGASLMSLKQRLEIFGELGLDFVIVVDFTESFSQMQGIDFVRILVQKCSMKVMAEGRDFTFGARGACSMRDLKSFSSKFGFEVYECNDVNYDGQKISSTRIRDLVSQGNFLLVHKMLKRPYAIDCSGLSWKETDGRFSCNVPQDLLVPGAGVYDVVSCFSDRTVLHSVLKVECGKFDLNLPTENYARKLEKIVFQQS